MSDDTPTMPPPSEAPDTDLSGLDPAGEAMRDIARRLSLLPEILAAVNASALNMSVVAAQMQSLGTAIEHLGRDLRIDIQALRSRVAIIEAEIPELKRRVADLERAACDG